MRRTWRKLIIILIALLVMLLPTTIVKASEAAPAQNVSLEKIEIMSPYTGTYGIGQKIKVVLTYDKEIQTLATTGETTSDSISYKFGDNGAVRQSGKGTISGKTLTYEVEIQENDMGVFTVTGYSISFTSGEDTVSKSGENPEVIGNVITADTTPEPPAELTWTDTSSTKIETSAKDSTVTRTTSIKISGITEKEGHNYYVFLTNSATKPELTFDGEYDGIDTDTITGYLSSFTSESGFLADKYYELKSDTYLYIVEEQLNDETNKYENKFIVSNYKVTWPQRRSLGSRIKGYFFNDATSTFISEISDERETAGTNISVKIGRVTDTNILRAIQRGDSDCLSKLLNYAKSANSVYNGTVVYKGLEDAPTITDKFDLVDEAYYYVYMVVDDEDGEYYPIEDVSLYQALVDDDIGKNLFDYLDDNFKWNLEEETPPPPAKEPDDTTVQGKLPQTGQAIVIGVTCIGLVTLTVIFAKKIKKYSI